MRVWDKADNSIMLNRDNAPELFNGLSFTVTNSSTGTKVEDENIDDEYGEYSVLSETVNISTCSIINGGKSIADRVYNGTAHIPAPSVKIKSGSKTLTLKNERDYKLSYVNNINAGTAAVIVRGIGSYSGTVRTEFTIKGKELNKCRIANDAVALGSSIDGAVHLFDGQYELKKGVDYDYTPVIAAEKGTVRVEIVPIAGSNFTWSNKTKGFTVGIDVIKLNLSKNEQLIKPSDVTLKAKPSESDKWTTESGSERLCTTYDGAKKTLDVFVMVSGKELTSNQFSVSYKNNINAGVAYVIVKGKGIYKGHVTKTFRIRPALGFSSVTVNKGKDVIFTGRLLKPSVIVKAMGANGKEKKLSKKDYTVSYISNINAGKAYVRIAGIGNYGGVSATYLFNISPRNLKNVSKSVKSSENITLKYGGRTLVKEHDYTITIEDSSVLGRKKVTITGLGNYKGVYVKDKMKK